MTKEEIVKHFRYFAIDNSIILALLEQHLGNEQGNDMNWIYSKQYLNIDFASFAGLKVIFKFYDVLLLQRIW